MANDSRFRMVRGAADLIRSRGISATSFSDVLAESGAPRGSIYHHFPDGKAQLAEEAVRWTSERVLAYQRDPAPTTPAAVLDRFVELWRRTVLASGGAAGCVVAGVAIDTVATEPGLMDVVRATFSDWIALLADQLEAGGLPASRATPIAAATVAGMEGALILCRAQGDVGPLELVASEFHRLVSDP